MHRSVSAPGSPLTYFNDGGGGFRVIFWGLKFWPKAIFWVYERRWNIFGSRKIKSGVLGGCEKRTKGFFGVMLKKSSDIFR